MAARSCCARPSCSVRARVSAAATTSWSATAGSPRSPRPAPRRRTAPRWWTPRVCSRFPPSSIRTSTSGRPAAITRRLAGEELTEMAELRDAGALGFSDDGGPVRSARVLRRALQYQRLAGGVIALHEEDPELSGEGVMHEGPVSALLGMAGIPSVSESTMIARDATLAGYENARIH